MADVVVRFRTEGSQQVRGAMAGIARDTERARSQSKRGATDAARAEARAATDAARARVGAEADVARSTLTLWQRVLGVFRGIEASKRRESERTAAAQIRDNERVERDARRRSAGLRGAIGSSDGDPVGRGGRGPRFGGRAISLAGIGVGLAMSEVRAAQGALGIETPEELYGRLQGARTTYLRQANAARQSPEQVTQTEAYVRQVATSSLSDVPSLYESLASSQEKFSNLPTAIRQLNAAARITGAIGGDMVDMTDTLGEFNRQFGISADTAENVAYGLVAAGEKGSLSPADFARFYSPVMGRYVAARGSQGQTYEGAMDFIAGAQVVRTGSGNAEIGRTRVANIMENMTRRRYIQSMRSIGGVNMVDENNQAISLAELSRRLVASPKLRNRRGELDPVKFARAMPDAQAAAGMLSLAFEEERGRGVSSIASAMPSEGRSSIDRWYNTYPNTSGGRDQRLRVERQVAIDEQLDSMSASFHSIADAATQVENRFPLLAGRAERVIGAFQQVAMTSYAVATAQTAQAAASLAAATSLSMGARALGAMKLGAGAAVAGAAGWGVGRLIANATGSDDAIGSRLFRRLGRNRGIEDWYDSVARSLPSLNSMGGGRSGNATQRVQGEVSLAPESIAAIQRGAAPAPGEGRRNPGGPERRP